LRSRSAAFTLIELMVAVAILGLGMTIVFLKVDTLLPGSRL
jgi:prepilin-type N-terminal cleavage/methylation domain-containing protein